MHQSPRRRRGAGVGRGGPDVTDTRPRAILTDRRFGPYLAGNFISSTGNWFQNVAAGIVVFQMTGSNTLVGLVSVTQFLATMFLSPWSGALADRFDRRKLLILAQLVAAAGALGLAIWVGLAGVSGLPGVWPVFVASGIIGLGYALGVAAMNALLPALVEPPQLEGAVALNSAGFTLARTVGPALAGLVVAALGAAWAFSINVLTFLPLVAALVLIRPRTQARPPGDRSVRAGLKYVRERRAMVYLLTATFAVGWAADPVMTLAPAYAELFGEGEVFVGLQVAIFGAGAAVASVLVARIRRRWSSAATTRLGLTLLAVGLAGYALAPTPALVLAALFLAGGGFLFGATTTNSNLQRRLDESMRGRVMALWSMAFLGSRPVAAMVDGAVADLISPRMGVAVAAVPLLAGFWAVTRIARSDREGAA